MRQVLRSTYWQWSVPGGLVDLMLTSIAAIRTVIKGMADGQPTRDQSVDDVLDDIRAELNDHAFLQAIDLHYQREKCSQYVDPEYTAQLLSCIHLLNALLEAPTIWQGLDIPRTKQQAARLILYYRYLSLPQGRINNTLGWLFYTTLLMCGGFIVRMSEVPERISSSVYVY
jgi:hypothetical protein